ncbi:serine hydrolase domain-containing protein [Actinosynnema sp. NPDC047251]|uniref:Serine-type D-Ala-D-Ala carboxypeptidase n=1 Tax=Saccharothrix espanaensis (strain ATCC 51144 / DSM 44229 / JCM 9112 / NBRC 15066 / NRRL 15764) TaxID=1179773 RepID=K0K9I3_SACES|nr:serine hydrolase domain-containing protein [Saccharothrix espanaensis]CCH33283.1 Serine-type D-Ala-D-Ala carboxypeptidase [Saccharothrix espanaensis DSM 44229]
MTSSQIAASKPRRTRKTARRAGVAAVAVALLAGVATPAVAAPDRSAGRDRPELRAAMREIVDLGVAGVQVRVRDQRGEWAGSAGVRELGKAAAPPTNGRFRVGSATKTFTATVVLQLVGEGEIGLDAPAADYLPRFGLDRRITVRMLLQHTSGVFNQTGEYYPDGTVVPGITWSGREWVENRFRTYRPAELVRFALAKPLRFAPGTDWSYSNTNYVLARLLVEEVTGRPYAEELRRRVLRPLGLSGTSVPGTSPEVPGPHAHAYYRYEDGGRTKTVDVTRQNPSWISSAGDLISTTEDLATFASALAAGKLLPAPLLAEMRAPHPKSGVHRYGLGLFAPDLGPNCGGALLNHNGGVQGFATLMYSTPDGRKTLTASLTYVDDAAMSLAGTVPKVVETLTRSAFCE